MKWVKNNAAGNYRKKTTRQQQVDLVSIRQKEPGAQQLIIIIMRHGRCYSIKIFGQFLEFSWIAFW